MIHVCVVDGGYENEEGLLEFEGGVYGVASLDVASGSGLWNAECGMILWRSLSQYGAG